MRALIPLLTVLLVAALAGPADAATAKKPWPPKDGTGHLFAHYGEEHFNDVDGMEVLPRVVADVIRYRPGLVTMSGDKGDDGTTEQLEGWEAIMAAYDEAGIPYMAGVGNHDGKQPTPEAVTDASGGSTPLRDITYYRHVFEDRPYPMGDGTPYDDPQMAPRERPAGDPAGAATHFFVDYGNVRWVFLDNSCYGIINCDPLQLPPDDRGRSQYEYLADAARQASADGRLVFVVMHMPTRDPRDQLTSYYTSVNHVMGKGISPDNVRFEQEAEALGVDAVFLGHIKGQFLYTGRGDIPYYVDGGAGGELYSTGPLGVDHGYWYGWRLIRVDGDAVTTDAIPVIVADGITVEGPERLAADGDAVRYGAFARQPATASDRAVVERLELRDPDPTPRGSATAVPGWIVWLLPLALVPVLALAARRPARGVRRLRRAAAVGLAGLVGAAGLAGAATAQRSEPTSTPREALPNPARIWTTSNPLVLAPVASESDDPRRDPARQTADGQFAPRCPGRATLRITSGHEQTARRVTVESRPGPVARGVRRGARTVRRERAARVATVHLAQDAVVKAVVRRGGRRVATVQRRACLPSGRHAIGWTPARGLRKGRHRLVVRVLSDRSPVRRALPLRVR